MFWALGRGPQGRVQHGLHGRSSLGEATGKGQRGSGSGVALGELAGPIYGTGDILPCQQNVGVLATGVLRERREMC